MAEGELTGTDPVWAQGRNFFDEVAVCTKTPAFYGKFLEGVKRGFLNAVFNFTFDHREIPTRVRVHMMTMPDAHGQQIVVVLVTRMNRPVLITEAFKDISSESGLTPAFTETAPSGSDAVASQIANAVMAVVNRQSNDLVPATNSSREAARISDVLKF